MRALNRSKGFSLMELMIVLAIIGILLSIAIPNYNDYLRKGRKAAATAFLAEAAGKQSQYLLNVRSYATTWAQIGMTAPDEVTTYYTVPGPGGDNAVTPPTYRITATPIIGKGQEALGTLEILSSGQRVGNW